MPVATQPTAAPASTSEPPISLQQYLRTTYEPDCDFVDGFLEERRMGENAHSTIQVELIYWFRHRQDEWKIRVKSELRTRVSDTRVRVPDVCVVAADARLDRILETPALLAIEILSPEDRLPRVLIRLKDFLAMGVPNVWLIDPIERAAFVYTSSGLRLVEETRLSVADSPIYLDLPGLFAALD